MSLGISSSTHRAGPRHSRASGSRAWGLRAVALACLLLAFAPAQRARATSDVIFVESLSGWSDPAACSLRDGILAANRDEPVGACIAGSGDDEIVINVAGVINLTTALPAITSSMAIRGPSTGEVSIQRDPAAPLFRLFDIYSTSGTWLKVSISGIRLGRGAMPDSNGGAVLVNDGSTLVVKNVVFEDNLAANGGALFTQGPLEVSRSVFRGNVALVGGGAAFTTDSATISTSLFISNVAYGGAVISPSLGGGGALRLNMGPNRVVNSLFVRNSVSSLAVGGAAIRISSLFPTVIAHSTVVGGEGINPQSAIYATGGGTYANITNTVITSHTVAIHRGGAVTVTQDFNLFFGVVTPVVGIVAGGAYSRLGAPLFVDTTTDNYRLQPDSAAVDKGTWTDVEDDFDGGQRPLGWGPDIGAFEYAPNFEVRRVRIPIVSR